VLSTRRRIRTEEEADFRLQLGNRHARIGELNMAVDQFDLSIDPRRRGARAPDALEQRYRAKGLLGDISGRCCVYFWS
jgi:hypothetical protein